MATLAPAAADDLPALIASMLRGDEAARHHGSNDAGAAAFVACARGHGIAPLLDARWRGACTGAAMPGAVRQACHEETVACAASELGRRNALRHALAALAAAGIHPLLAKGAALAYSHYATPALRPRVDDDLLVTPAETQAAAHILFDLGYRRVAGPAGAGVGFQVELHREDRNGITHNVDLHWRISNAQSFAWLLPFEELAAASVPVPALGPYARRLGDVHALLLALMHRVGNNLFVAPGFGDRLIWLYDIHLLVEAMTDDDLRCFRHCVERTRVVAIAIEGLRRCAARFGSPRVAALATELESSPVAASGARLLRAGKLHREWLELCAVPTATSRARYVASRVFPSRDYLHERFPDAADRALPALYARRWLARVRAAVRGR
ncbi:MAG: nucleotidyltransferase family protein [Burkholderiales bacterium]